MNILKKHIVYFCLGTNLGNKKKNLSKTIQQIGNRCGRVKGSSGIYQSVSWGYQSKNIYYNQCLKVETELNPEKLLEEAIQIEQQMGRDRREEGYADRIIDIDILFYDDILLNTQNLVIPHPRILERKFVLMPMEDLAPDFLHPSLHETMKELAAKCGDSTEVKKL